MTDFQTLEPAIDPENRITFLLDWEITKKCNLDCSYCGIGIDKGHDNSYPHPDLDDCYETINFMFKYADLYMQHKPKGIKYVVLNVYGGEALHHPNILEILKRVHEVYNDQYKDRWSLTVTNTTNLIIKESKLEKLLPYIDEFTVSYHSETTPVQKNWFKSNCIKIQESGTRLKCVLPMYTKLFDDSVEMTNWLVDNNIRLIARQLDQGAQGKEGFLFTKEQTEWFKNYYEERSFSVKLDDIDVTGIGKGRPCCGGRSLCIDHDMKKRHYFVNNNNFQDWYCGVNHFFVFIRQQTKQVFNNKDCTTNWHTGEIGELGTVDKGDELLEKTKIMLEGDSIPYTKCVKSRCRCGVCAPKAIHLDDYNKSMEKYFK
jgi:organic radical activating enzyme